MRKDFILSVVKFIFTVFIVVSFGIILYQNIDSEDLNNRVDIVNAEQSVDGDIFEIVLKDYNNSGCILRFKYNDTLFLYYKSGYGVGLTQMYDVDGTPLTYEKYLQN